MRLFKRCFEATGAPGAGRRPGFTITELLTALTLSAVVLVGVLGVMIAETRRLSLERELSDAAHTLRSAAALMSWDLRQAAAGDTAIDAMTDTSFVVRSPIAAGVVCAKNASGYTLSDVAGVFGASAGDSVQVLFAAETPSWEYFRVQAMGAPGTVGPALCVTAATPVVGIKITVPMVKRAVFDTLGEAIDTVLVPKDTAGVLIGVPFMAYRRTLYGVCSAPMPGCPTGGDRWLARRVSGSATWEPLTGPLHAGGLEFSYHAMDGTETANPWDVVAVRITLRSESYGRITGHERMRDTLSVRVHLRNCDPRVC